MNRGAGFFSFIMTFSVLAGLLAGTQPFYVSASPQGAPTSPFVAGQIIIGLAGNAGISSVESVQGVQVEAAPQALAPLNVAVVNVPVGQEEQFRKRLLTNPAVVFAEPNYIVQVEAVPVVPDDPLYPPSSDFPLGQYGPGQIRADYAWNVTTGSPDVILAVVDSGLDAGHPEFVGRTLPSYDFVEKDNAPQDGCGHGTHVAGIAAATGNNATGIAGVDWQAKILPVRVIGSNCTGTILDVAAGIVYATDRGAKVINLSLGVDLPSTLLEDAVFYAYSRGVAVMAAAGNDTSFGMVYPAAYDAYVLAVGATDNTPEAATFSSTGPALDVMAPGVNILSTLPRGPFFFEQPPEYGTPKYGLLSGTSMAAAFASGAAALLLAYATDRFNTPDKLYEAFEKSARDLGPPGRDDQYGYGLIQVDAALDYIPTSTPNPTPLPPLKVEYDLLSSDRCQNIAYTYQTVPHDFTHYPVGNALALFGEDDWAEINLPFTFPFGGEDYKQVIVSANGILSFDGPPNSGDPFSGDPSRGEWENGENSFIPGGGALMNRMQYFAAPFWDDLTTSSPEGAGVYAARLTNPNRFVVEWNGVGIMKEPKYLGPTGAQLTFQAVLYENGEIRFNYKSMKGSHSSGDSATIGLEYNGGRGGVEYAFDRKGAVAGQQSIDFIPVAPGSTRSRGCLYATQVGPGGATVSQPPFCLTIPEGLLKQETTVSITTFGRFSPLPAGASLGHFAEITLQPEPFAPLVPPPVVCYSYTAQDVLAGGGSPANLYLAAYDPETLLWERLPTALEKEQLRLEAPVSHFSVFGVFAPPQPEKLPVTGSSMKPAWGWAILLLLLAAPAWLGVRRWKKLKRLVR